jgi:hypothetical protein
VARDEQLIEEIRLFLDELDSEAGLVATEEQYLYVFNAKLSTNLRLGQILMNVIPVALLRKVLNSEFDCYYSDDSEEIRASLKRLRSIKWPETNN